MRQLIFTSVLVGLSSGRSGFCTVARSASLRERTVAELEKMSDYDPPAGTRPTVFLFRVYSGGNEPLYILSRACDAGTDVFGRPNHVVHHLIFHEKETAELPPPAEVALRFRGWVKKYEGAPRLLPDDEPLPAEILRGNGERLLPAKRWAALTGDGGNAALLCPHGEPRATVFLGDETMTETVLGLFAESAETLGGGNAWEIAFSTGICSRNGAGRFLWRMVGERDLAVRRPGDFILDFLAPLSLLRAPETEFAEYARSGNAPARRAAVHSRKIPLPGVSFPKENAPEAATAPEASAEPTGVPEPAPRISPADAVPEGKRFSDIAGTAKFLGISSLVFVVVMIAVFFMTPPPSSDSSAQAQAEKNAASDADETSRAVAAFGAILEERIASGDFAGAAEAWLSFADAFPSQADAQRQNFVPRFKLKIAGAYAEKFSRRLRLLDAGGKFSEEEKRILAAELAMFRRVCLEFELTEGRIQRKNLAVIERAEAVVGEDAR